MEYAYNIKKKKVGKQRRKSSLSIVYYYRNRAEIWKNTKMKRAHLCDGGRIMDDLFVSLLSTVRVKK